VSKARPDPLDPKANRAREDLQATMVLPVCRASREFKVSQERQERREPIQISQDRQDRQDRKVRRERKVRRGSAAPQDLS
jgi:hypothetical protein